MTQTSINYAKVLYELEISNDAITDVKELLCTTPELLKSLTSPIVSKSSKLTIIEKVFPIEIQNFLKVLCEYQSIGLINEIFCAYKNYCDEKEDILQATLTYVTKPDMVQEDKIKEFLLNKFHKSRVELNFIYNPELIGGFVLEAENKEYDQSVRGRLQQLQQKLVR